MIRRAKGSRWLDKELLLHLPRMHYRRIVVDLGAKDINNIRTQVRAKANPEGAKLNAFGKKGTALVTMELKCGIIPGLAKLLGWSRGEVRGVSADFELGVKWMQANNVWTTNLNSTANPYHAHLKMLVKSSAKISQTKSLLLEQLGRKDFLGRPSRGIIFLKHNEPALVFYKWLMDKSIGPTDLHQELRPRLVYGSMPKNQRQEAANEFQNGDCNLLIGVTEALGTGLTLTRATFMIFVEQEGDPGNHKQAIGRMLRNSNYNWAGLNIFELYSQNFGPEEIVFLRRQGRLALADLKVQQVLDAEVEDPEDDAADDKSDTETYVPGPDEV